jgi:protein transport protein SEC24
LQEFCSRPPTPASFVFLIDVSWNAVQSGMLQVATQTIKEMLDLFPVADDQPTSPCKISIVTFDRAVHFYNLNVSALTFML